MLKSSDTLQSNADKACCRLPHCLLSAKYLELQGGK